MFYYEPLISFYRGKRTEDISDVLLVCFRVATPVILAAIWGRTKGRLSNLPQNINSSLI